MDVSVIIVNYNTFLLTCNCIRSVKEKTLGLAYEIILVDNASADRNPDDFLKEFPDITLVKSPDNCGFAKGNNLGIARSTGNYVLLLNSDTELVNNAIHLAWERMKADPNIGVLSSKLIFPDGRLQYPASRTLSLKYELRELLRMNRNLTKEQKADLYLSNLFNHEEEKEADWVWGAFFMMPRIVLNRFPEVVPGQTEAKLPDKFFMYVEDIMWCWYIKKLGYKVLYYPDAVVIHYIGGSSKGAKAAGVEKDDSGLAEAEKRIKGMMKLLPNQFKFLTQTRGRAYAISFFATRAMLLYSIRTPDTKAQATAYVKALKMMAFAKA
ncbi:MAG: glycosyltransferase family 2 protein [Bacteroidota bacterium]